MSSSKKREDPGRPGTDYHEQVRKQSSGAWASPSLTLGKSFFTFTMAQQHLGLDWKFQQDYASGEIDIDILMDAQICQFLGVFLACSFICLIL
jgi:hypothetical protein